MQRARASRMYTILLVLLCGCAAGLLPACDEAVWWVDDDPDGDPGAADPEGGEDPGASPDPGFVPPDLDGCLTRISGGGLASMALNPAVTLGVIDLDASVTALDVDAVIGLSRGPATGLGQLAAAVRFGPDGALQARDGAAYAADYPFPFETSMTYRMRIVADLPSRAYSVYVRNPDTGEVVRLARRYALRPPAGSAPRLDALAAVAGGPSGKLTVCNVIGAPPSSVVYSREGSYTVAPLPGDGAILSDGVSTTWKVGPRGQVLRQAARGGEVAADPAGNVYVALSSGGQLALHAFTPQLAPRWSRVDPVEPFADVQAIAADAAGVTVALVGTHGVASIRRYPSNGSPGSFLHAGGSLAALGPDGYAIATMWEGGLAVLLYDLAGELRWARTFDVPATVEVLTLGLGGRVVFGGHFSGQTTFGGPTLEVAYQDGVIDINSYVVALSSTDGAHLFTSRLPTTVLTGAAGNSGRLVIAGETWVTPVFPHLWQLDPAGNLLPGEPYTGFYEEWGRSGRVAISASNRIYWERSMVWPTPYAPPFPYLLAIAP